MRCSHSECLSTFVFTTLLFILSFTVTAALAESANVHGFRARHAWRKRAPLDVIPTSQLLSSTSILPTIVTSLATGFSPTPTSLPSISVSVPSPLSVSPPSIPTPSSLPMLNPTTTSTSSDSSTPSPTSTITTITTTAPTSQAQVQTTNQGTPLSSSSSHPSSSQHSSAAVSSTPGVATVGAATPIVQNSVTLGYSGVVTTTSDPTGTTISATPSSGPSSNSGFFSNTGAVAGTFTIAGLFGVAGVIGVGMMIARRRASRSYEDDMEYLEKKLDPAIELSQGQDFVVGDIEDLSDLSHVSNTMEVAVPPAAHLYPQHDVYLAHGQTTNGSDGYESQAYYPQEAYPPQMYGIAYPSRESYAAADAYGGMDESSGMPNPFDNIATELPAALQHSDEQLRTASPPLTAYLHRSIDSFYGSSETASYGHAM